MYLKVCIGKKTENLSVPDGELLILNKFTEYKDHGYKKLLPNVDIYVKMKIENLERKKFTHTEEEKCMYILKLYNPKITIVVFEFDGENNGIKRKQLTEIMSMKFDEGVILIGNTNIQNWQKTFETPKGWYDAWEELGNETNKNIDGERNYRIFYKNIILNNFELSGSSYISTFYIEN